jgi:hypothetical protein
MAGGQLQRPMESVQRYFVNTFNNNSEVGNGNGVHNGGNFGATIGHLHEPNKVNIAIIFVGTFRR